MPVFDLEKMTAFSYAERQKNVFYKTDAFTTRIIELPPGGEMPACQMECHVIFHVVRGRADIKVNGDVSKITVGQCLITPPATLSMKTNEGVKLLGIQIQEIIK